MKYAKDICSYFWYIILRNAPTNNLRLLALKKISYIQVGQNCYVGPNITITPFGGGKAYYKENKKFLVEIGKNVAIGPNVMFLCSMNPENSELSKIYGKVSCIVVKDDVWIGAGAIILAGITLNQKSVIGAGAVVTRDVPEYTVVGGVPAKHLKNLPLLNKSWRYNDE